jgi:hypothetical protein
MKISNDVIRHYLRNVYFIRGLARINNRERDEEYSGAGFFAVVRENHEMDTREEVCATLAKHFGLM